MRTKVGDVVRISEAVFGAHAIVLEVKPGWARVHTGNAELLYEPEFFEPFATIRINQRRYGTHGGNRFNVCQVRYADGRTKELHVKTRSAEDLGEVTQALEIRKLAFLQIKEC